MLELASLGAQVLQGRAVEFAKNYGVPVEVRSTFTTARGTRVTEELPEMEKVIIRGVAHDKNQAKVSVLGIPDQPGVASRVFTVLAEANVNVDMIIQNVSHEGKADITFTVPQDDLHSALLAVNSLMRELGAPEAKGDGSVAKVSVVGVGMKSHPGVAARMFSALAAEGINIQMISTSEIKISCVVDEAQTDLAVRTLHAAFDLGAAPD